MTDIGNDACGIRTHAGLSRVDPKSTAISTRRKCRVIHQEVQYYVCFRQPVTHSRGRARFEELSVIANASISGNAGYSSVGRASDCSHCGNQMVPGSIPGGRTFAQAGTAGLECEKTKDAHAGTRTRVTSMGGLYDVATLHAL